MDRSVTGSMNDLIREATAWLAEGELSPLDVGVRLNDTLLSALGRGGSAPKEESKSLTCRRGCARIAVRACPGA